MVADLQHDFQAFQRFLGVKLEAGESPASLEQALEEFRAY